MIKVSIKVSSDNYHQALKVFADTSVDLADRDLVKSGHLIVNRVNGTYIFNQEFRRGYGYAEIHKDGDQRIRDDAKPQEVKNPL